MHTQQSIVAGAVTALVLLWRDRTSTWQAIATGALLMLMLMLMIGWSGHEDVLMGIALVLTAVTLVQAIRGRDRGAGPVRSQIAPQWTSLPVAPTGSQSSRS